MSQDTADKPYWGAVAYGKDKCKKKKDSVKNKRTKANIPHIQYVTASVDVAVSEISSSALDQLVFAAFTHWVFKYILTVYGVKSGISPLLFAAMGTNSDTNALTPTLLGFVLSLYSLISIM